MDKDKEVQDLYNIALFLIGKCPSLDSSLASLINAVEEKKPNADDFKKFDKSLLECWYKTLCAYDDLVEPDVLNRLGPAQSFLEDVLESLV